MPLRSSLISRKLVIDNRYQYVSPVYLRYRSLSCYYYCAASGTILRPGFIYGKRRVNGVDIPLDIVGEPLEKLLAATATLTRPLLNLPASDLLLAPPTSVDDVAIAVVRAVDDDSVFGTFNIEQIKEMATA